MKIILIIISLFVTGIVFGQEAKTSDFLPEISKSDISSLWTLKKFRTELEGDTSWVERMEPLGYIGENYQRFYIHFSSVIHNPGNRLGYFVYGKTRVKTNICEFQGLIKVKEAKTYYDKEFPSIKQGFLNGTYEFYEDSNLKGTGVFKGKFKTEFYIDKNGQIKYNSLMFLSDGFKNNQFEGTWTSYKFNNPKTCNWGDYRIPNSKELDGGAGDFAPSVKFMKNGWENYCEMNSSDKLKSAEAIKKEELQWWINNE